ncbi:MAG: DUF11 domain-containing protein [Gemmataceae bacterium]|nr:DUF11 domain-containing protein [Gemmataceae bacterium]
MTRKMFLLAGFLALCATSFLPAQTPNTFPNQGASPLLWLRFQFPDGMKTMVYPNQQMGILLGEAPVAAFRPGYLYRIKLTNLSTHQELFPTLEIRGSLKMPKVADPAKFHAPIAFSQMEIDSALQGNLLTKVIYLEDPEKAEPVATTTELPIESRVPQGDDILAEARKSGRIMVILRVGGRSVDEKELLSIAIPGTLLPAGERYLGPPRFPPNIPIHTFTMADPRLGPKPPMEELVYEGGDHYPLAGFDNQGLLKGVNPEDTVAEYKDAAGNRKLVRSNRLLLCVPRFAVLSQEQGYGNLNSSLRSGERTGTLADGQLRLNTPSKNTQGMEHLNSYRQGTKAKGTENRTFVGKLEKLEVLQARVLDLLPAQSAGLSGTVVSREAAKSIVARQRENMKLFSSAMGLNSTLNLQGTSVVARLESSPQVIYSTADTREAVMTEEEVRVEGIHKPLRLLKLSDKAAGQPGDIITFTLHYQNLGVQPIVDLAVVDSLAGRLEYVANTSQSDRDSVFTIQKNEAGSQTLRWEITGKLMPKESGIIRFQVKVR